MSITTERQTVAAILGRLSAVVVGEMLAQGEGDIESACGALRDYHRRAVAMEAMRPAEPVYPAMPHGEGEA